MNIFEQEVEQIREQSKIKEANFEEEIAILKEQVKDRECQTVTENIELISLAFFQAFTLPLEFKGFWKFYHIVISFTI